MRLPASRLGLLLIALLSSGCSNAASTSPTSTGTAETGPAETVPAATGPAATDTAPTTPPGTPAEPARRTLLVDTDVAGDDLVALAVLVAIVSGGVIAGRQ